MSRHIISLMISMFLYAPVAFAKDDELEAITDIGKLAKNLVMTVFWVILAVAVVVAIVFIARRYMHAASMSKVKSDTEQLQDEIDGYLEKKDYAGAAAVYQRIGEMEKAARLYMQGNKPLKAATIYEDLQKFEKAIELYIRAGESLRAASLHIKLKNYYEAAKIFKNKGDRVRAAQALELYGNKLGAAKEYKEAGLFLQAAKLYRELNLYPETAEMFRLLLEDKVVSESTVGQYYMYATFLALTEQNDAALEVFRQVHAFDQTFRDVAQRIEQLSPSTPQPQPQPESATAPEKTEPEKVISDVSEIYAHATEGMEEEVDDIEALIEQELARRDGVPVKSENAGEEVSSPGETAEADPSKLQRETTLKNMIRSGSLEPRYAMKLWVEVLRKLKAMHDRGQFIGVLSPHTISIDMENNIRIEPPPVPPSVYLSPEFRDGSGADAQTDIYSAGVLLFEMVTGSLEDFGSKNPSQLDPNIPEWIDEFVLRCTENEREHRYKTLDDIYSKLLELRDKM